MTVKKGIVVASGGGHWMQALRLRPAFEGHDVLYLTTLPGLPEQAGVTRAAIIPECNRNTPLRMVLCLVALWRILRRERPDWILSTGALPGYLALRLAHRRGIRTVWVDSVAETAPDGPRPVAIVADLDEAVDWVESAFAG